MHSARGCKTPQVFPGGDSGFNFVIEVSPKLVYLCPLSRRGLLVVLSSGLGGDTAQGLLSVPAPLPVVFVFV